MPIQESPHLYEEIMVGDQKVVLDNRILQFNENNLNEFMKHMDGYYSFYGAQLQNMEKIVKDCEDDWEIAFGRAYDHYREQNLDVKRAELLAKGDTEAKRCRDMLKEAQRRAGLLKSFLRGLDKAADNAQSLGHNLRKEMDKLNPEIYVARHGDDNSRGTPSQSRVAEMARRARELSGEEDPLA